MTIPFFRPATVHAALESIDARPQPAAFGLGCWTGRRSHALEALELDELYKQRAYQEVDR